MSTSEGSGRFDRPRPLAGFRGIRREDIPREFFSGLTLAALVVPLNIGYAQVAGLPPTVGLYAGIVPLVVFALFTSSRHVVGGPGPATAAMVAAALAGFAAPGDPQRIQYALALALICGALFFLAWLFRLSYLENFLSKAVLIGFVSGLGVQVFVSQLDKILGVSLDTEKRFQALTERLRENLGLEIETEGFFLEIWDLIRAVPDANLYAVTIGAGSFLGVRLMKRYLPRIPGALAVLIGMTAVVAAMGLEEKGVSVLGELPAGLPTFTLPEASFNDYLRLFPGAVALVAITLAEGLLLVRAYAHEHSYKADGNQVLFAYGAANAAAGLTGSLVTGNSVSRSAAMDSAGARSQLPSLVAAGTIGLVLLFFTDLLALLPNAALAGIVANSVLSLISVSELREMYRKRRSEFWIAAVCLLAVPAVGPLRAVVIAFVLSIIDLVRRVSQPFTSVMKEAPDGSHYQAAYGRAQTEPGLIVYRFSASLYFANTSRFSDEIETLVSEAPAPVDWFVLDAERIGDLDTAGAEAVDQALHLMERHGVSFGVSRASEVLLELLETYGLLAKIGSDRFFATNRDAAEAFRAEA